MTNMYEDTKKHTIHKHRSRLKVESLTGAAPVKGGTPVTKGDRRYSCSDTTNYKSIYYYFPYVREVLKCV